MPKDQGLETTAPAGQAPTDDIDELRAWLGRALSDLVEADDGSSIEPDEEGDFPIGVGDTVVFVRPEEDEDSNVVSIFTPLIESPSTSPELYRALNDLNLLTGACKLILTEDELVVLAAEAPADGFTTDALAWYLATVAGLAPDLEPKLRERFGGEPCFESEGDEEYEEDEEWEEDWDDVEPEED